MNNNPIINPMPYLRTSWEFPETKEDLKVELGRSYLEVASFVNDRTIGLYPKNKPAIGGESWYLTTQKQQNLRQVYTFIGPAPIANIPHNIDFIPSLQFTKCSGSYTDGTNWYGCIFGSNVAIAGQFSFYITPNTAPGVLDGNIVVLDGGGTPALTSGIIILEWLSRTSSSSNT